MIKFEDLKGCLRQKISSSYLLSGVDEYLLSSAYKMIVKATNLEVEDLNLIKFAEGVIDCNDIVRACETMPVFGDKKVVYLDLRLAKKSELKNIKLLNDYLESANPTTVLIINSGSNEDDFGLDKKRLELVDCNRLDIKFVEAKVTSVLKAKQKSISAIALKMLIEYCLGDMAKIMVETDKLIAYIGDRAEIKNTDIEEIVTRSIEYQVFELTEALAKKNSQKVYSILGDMKAKRDEYKMLPALIYAHFRRLFHISLNSGTSNAELAKMLGVKEFAVKMAQSQAKLFSKSALKKINTLCAGLDFDLKQSNISMENTVDLIVLTILNV
jgi:DNA polymerase-3 subunit delta